jgi:hypothetical protein
MVWAYTGLPQMRARTKRARAMGRGRLQHTHRHGGIQAHREAHYTHTNGTTVYSKWGDGKGAVRMRMRGGRAGENGGWIEVACTKQVQELLVRQNSLVDDEG